MTEPRVHMRHVRALKLCARGARAWCARHGVDWAQLRGEGVPVERMRAVGDDYALRAVALAEAEVARG